MFKETKFLKKLQTVMKNWNFYTDSNVLQCSVICAKFSSTRQTLAINCYGENNLKPL